MAREEGEAWGEEGNLVTLVVGLLEMLWLLGLLEQEGLLEREGLLEVPVLGLLELPVLGLLELPVLGLLELPVLGLLEALRMLDFSQGSISSDVVLMASRNHL